MFRNSVSKVTVIGNLAQDPEMRYTASGTAVTSLNIPANRVYTANGEKVEETIWHQVAMFGKLAELVCETLKLKKGAKVYVVGTLAPEIRIWGDPPRANYEIRADEFTVLDFGKNESEKDLTGEIPF